MIQRTLYDKLVDSHTVRKLDEAGNEVLLYIDRTVLNEYTSPQAFSGLREAGRKVFRPQAALGVVDHVNSTRPAIRKAQSLENRDRQISYFGENCRDFDIELFDLLHPNQGIEHVVMTELGLVLPGMVFAAGDSHTTTYGAFGSLGFGIGTSDIEHYLATQTLAYTRLRTMLITVNGPLSVGNTAKDIIMAVIRRIGADGATGFAIEFAGSTIRQLSMEGRMTICNMAVECGARGAIVAPDDRTFEYLSALPRSPSGSLWDTAVSNWQTLSSDPGAPFDKTVEIDAADIEPMVTWGTSPDQAIPVTQAIPALDSFQGAEERNHAERALAYMGLRPGMHMTSIRIDWAFIGSCTNARLEDLRSASSVLKGRKVADGVRAIVVPGSSEVSRQAEAEGIARIFMDAGFEWRQSGCSMCLAMNDDIVPAGERCASSTNRNFEGRQGFNSRTHLMSPAMVAAAAVCGHICDIRDMEPGSAY
ncbi:MAG: 3-isopropylmalate dehydratase large subunit [Alphaproteobacteria bacterium]|nr:MAG: 3-isopropylmalate dehydratase large subunit [Alphaproteobacteria bacterium]